MFSGQACIAKSSASLISPVFQRKPSVRLSSFQGNSMLLIRLGDTGHTVVSTRGSSIFCECKSSNFSVLSHIQSRWRRLVALACALAAVRHKVSGVDGEAWTGKMEQKKAARKNLVQYLNVLSKKAYRFFWQTHGGLHAFSSQLPRAQKRRLSTFPFIPVDCPRQPMQSSVRSSWGFYYLRVAH